MFQSRELERLTKNLVIKIEDELIRIGLFYRIFHRVKDTKSLENKIERKGPEYYNGIDKYIRDVVGIRIIFYFSDDVNIVYEQLKTLFDLVEETVDKNEETKFAPTRINLVFKLPAVEAKEFSDIINNPVADCTFEVQLRTILSEGWHEVDHDLRYKCQDDWKNNTDLARNFNGILASIETSEYSILRLFEQLSFRHYKAKNLAAMIRTKYRLRFSSNEISDELFSQLDDHLFRQLFKVERSELVAFFIQGKFLIPLTLDNIIYIINHRFIKNQKLIENTPLEIIRELQSA